MGSGSWHMEKRDSFKNEPVKDVEHVLENGSLSIIVLGASGDLAKKKTFPALFNLFQQGFLQPNEVHIFGYARTKISDDELRNRIRGYLVRDKGASPKDLEDVTNFLQLIKYVSGSYDTEEGFRETETETETEIEIIGTETGTDIPETETGNEIRSGETATATVERAEDVLMHKRLLHLAHDPAHKPAIEVRLVQVHPIPDGNTADSIHSDSVGEDAAQSSKLSSRHSIHPPPAFGSSPNLEALALEANTANDEDDEHSVHGSTELTRPMHEITFSTDDKPKLLSQLTSLLAEIGLNIQEAHAFSTLDGYSLDVFVVDGWPYEETEQLKTALEKEVLKIESPWPPTHRSSSSSSEHDQIRVKSEPPTHLTIPNDGTDVWEIDPRQLTFGNKVASGSCGDLYKGTYCTQEVAIKVLKPECVNSDMHKDFAQEVYIMRKVRHKNVVQFIGACTKPPSLCIVTEFMSGGSVYDYLHKQKGVFKLPALLKVAIDVSKGMTYLHQNNIIHRDLKAANLLMDENEVVKVADFGVARVKSQSGVMTAETGTYRWMAPEVIEHKPYDHRADVFSFGVVLWELLTGKLPYEYLTPLQAAVGVVQKGLRPTIPKNTHPKLVELLEKCWQQDPALRPDFSEIIEMLQPLAKEISDEGEEKRKSSGGFLSVLRRGHH